MKYSNFTVLYDACVLYSAPLRDLLMQLALMDLFRAKWSNLIHDEWIASLLKKRTDLRLKDLQKTRELMDAHVRDCLVDGFQDLIPVMNLPDPKDNHVLAAAVYAGANVIVTYNLKDFPQAELSKYGIEAQHPDEFIMHLIDLDPGVVCVAAKTVRARLKNPPKSQEEYLAILENQSLPQTVSHLKDFVELI